MAEEIYTKWTDEDLKRELMKGGHYRVKDMTLEKYTKQSEWVIEEALDMGKV